MKTKDPRAIHIDNIGFKTAVKKAFKKAGLKTAWDVVEYHNKYGITSVSGIGERHITHIVKTLMEDTDMLEPDIMDDKHPWEYKDVTRVIKIFISQPMSGRDDGEVLMERQDAIKHIYEQFKGKNVALIFIDQFHVDEVPPYANATWYLGHSIMLMARCDYVYFTGEWPEARGCLIEAEICKMYHIPILNEIIK
jgi:hypothetical protein